MLTAAENALLTQIEAGAPMGDLLRRYWHPIAAVAEMEERWTKRVRMFGEDLVLFRNRSGGFGLIAEACPHRRASLAYGIPAEDGIRCPYHGWKFDGSGACLEQPNEPAGSTFREKVSTPAYPVTELGGLLWAYLGPLPAPLIPRLDGFVATGTVRLLGHAIVPCNWLQIMENSVDATHTEWLHGALHEFVREKDGIKVAFTKRHLRVGFDEYEYGIIKRRVLEGHTEEDDDWKIGHPLLFPTTLAIGNASGTWHEFRFQMRVPVDDTHTHHFWYHAFVPRPGVTAPPHLLDRVHVYEVPFLDERGEFILDSIHGQDIMAWTKQGPIADRTREQIGSTDRGVTMYRRMLLRELRAVEAGRDPIMTFRRPEENQVINIPLEGHKANNAEGFASMFHRHETRYAPAADEIVQLYA